MSSDLVRVVAPHFVAGIVVDGDVCVQAAPILRRACLGRGRMALRAIFEQRGWDARIIAKGTQP